jgi:hypothetical protein
MNDRRKAPLPPRRGAATLTWWYGPMDLAGLAFGLLDDRRPFGEDALAHPLAVFFILVGVGLLLLRLAAARPVPELIPDRALLIGCVIGLVAYLAGNFVAVHWLVAR